MKEGGLTRQPSTFTATCENQPTRHRQGPECGKFCGQMTKERKGRKLMPVFKEIQVTNQPNVMCTPSLTPDLNKLQKTLKEKTIRAVWAWTGCSKSTAGGKSVPKLTVRTLGYTLASAATTLLRYPLSNSKHGSVPLQAYYSGTSGSDRFPNISASLQQQEPVLRSVSPFSRGLCTEKNISF